MRRLVVLFIAFSAAACEPERGLPPNLEARRAGDPAMQAAGVRYDYAEGERNRAIVHTPYAYETPAAPGKPGAIQCRRGVKIDFFDSLGRVESTLTANEAELRRAEGFAEARGQVVLINQKQEKLETEVLRWYQHKDRIIAPGFVKITSPRDLIYGDSLEADTRFSGYKLFRIRGMVELKEEE